MLWGRSCGASLLLLPFLATGVIARVSYQGYKVLRVDPLYEDDLRFLQQWEDDAPEGLEFWKSSSRVGQHADLLVAPELQARLEESLGAQNISYTEMIPDVERACEEENRLLASNASAPEDVLNSRSAVNFFSRYHRLEEIQKYISGLASSNPELAEVQNIGTSSEGKALQLIQIGTPRSNKSAIWMDGGMHAREWISPATVTYIATQLIHNYHVDPRVRKLVDLFDWYILPVANPDGYEYSHTEDRMWRKTRSYSSPLWFCRGVDPNRNFGYQWNTVGASIRPCSETYAGPRAFSEPETKAISDFVLRQKRRIQAFLTFHSYSQLWMTPWGYTSRRPTQYKDMEAVALKATSALKKVHGTQYKVGTSTSIMYAAAGGSDDWAHGRARIKYSYTVELRDAGRHGFLLPSAQIAPTGEETYEAVLAMAEEIVAREQLQ